MSHPISLTSGAPPCSTAPAKYLATKMSFSTGLQFGRLRGTTAAPEIEWKWREVRRESFLICLPSRHLRRLENCRFRGRSKGYRYLITLKLNSFHSLGYDGALKEFSNLLINRNLFLFLSEKWGRVVFTTRPHPQSGYLRLVQAKLRK